VGAELPTYQRLALAYGALPWASTPEPDTRIASIFDEVDPQTGPRFADAHERWTTRRRPSRSSTTSTPASRCW
jgi:hypothetical protein